MEVCKLISREWLKGSCSNLECGLPCVKANSTVNLVSFGLGIMELHMHENRDFVTPFNVLTPFACTPFSWAARHITMCLDHMTSLITGGRRFSEGTSADREIQRTLMEVCHRCDVI